MSVSENHEDQRPVGRLLTDLASQLSALMRAEFNLLRSEVKESAGSLKGAVVSMAIGAALLMAALVALVQAAITAIIEADVSPWVASTIVGVAVAVIGYLILMQGAKKLSPSEAIPDRTVRQVQKDATLIKETAK